jgi:hypothetical protein
MFKVTSSIASPPRDTWAKWPSSSLYWDTEKRGMGLHKGSDCSNASKYLGVWRLDLAGALTWTITSVKVAAVGRQRGSDRDQVLAEPGRCILGQR